MTVPFTEISGEQIVGLTKAFYSDPKNLLAQNAATSHDPLDFCIHHGAAGQNLHVYTHKVSLGFIPHWTV